VDDRGTGERLPPPPPGPGPTAVTHTVTPVNLLYCGRTGACRLCQGVACPPGLIIISFVALESDIRDDSASP
jgi:hypothetical protein